MASCRISNPIVFQNPQKYVDEINGFGRQVWVKVHGTARPIFRAIVVAGYSVAMEMFEGDLHPFILRGGNYPWDSMGVTIREGEEP